MCTTVHRLGHWRKFAGFVYTTIPICTIYVRGSTNKSFMLTVAARDEQTLPLRSQRVVSDVEWPLAITSAPREMRSKSYGRFFGGLGNLIELKWLIIVAAHRMFLRVLCFLGRLRNCCVIIVNKTTRGSCNSLHLAAIRCTSTRSMAARLFWKGTPEKNYSSMKNASARTRPFW